MRGARTGGRQRWPFAAPFLRPFLRQGRQGRQGKQAAALHMGASDFSGAKAAATNLDGGLCELAIPPL